jgi:hypothetical protein
MNTNETWMLLLSVAVSLLVVSTIAFAQSQVPLNLPSLLHHHPRDGGQKTLEIPVIVRPNQPAVDTSFVGNWCGARPEARNGSGRSVPA